MDWKQAYHIGIHEIDEQHRELVKNISAIEHTVGNDAQRSEVVAAVTALSVHAQNHFLLEESLMRIHDFPRLHEHANEHWRFLAELRILQDHSLTNLPQSVDLLREWLDFHIQTWDKPYALHVLKRLTLGGNST